MSSKPRTRKPRHNAAAAARVNAALASPDAPEPIVPASEFALSVLPDEPKRQRRRPNAPKLPKDAEFGIVVRGPGGVKLTQKRHLPPAAQPGVSATEAFFSVKGGTSAKPIDDELAKLINSGNYSHGLDDGPYFMAGSQSPEPTSRHRRRRLQQHHNWDGLLGGDIVDMYLRAKYRRGQVWVAPACACVRHSLRVVLADWAGSSFVNLLVCACAPASHQLMARGYFPCAPKRPSFAFSIALLQFISIHSLHVAPNVTAWAQSLEDFWVWSQTRCDYKGTLRKRLGVAITWYQALDNRAEVHVSRQIAELAAKSRETRKRKVPNERAEDDNDRKRAKVSVENDDTIDSNENTMPTGDERDSGTTGNGGKRMANNGTEDTQSVPLTRPSDQLRQKCPLCFGGKKPNLQHTEAHVIVCIDANFSQKRRKCAESDPPLEFINSRVLPPHEVDTMEQIVNERRKGKPKLQKSGITALLPDEVMDDCEQSFTAAQETVSKASKNYYAETGLMALLCRHDRVLWVVNMRSVGEKQHNALALLQRLNNEIPPDWKVGLLYDIACQLARSIDKWQLLEPLADRLVFAVSVFHAYGHQWACQVVFHPRKREGFGLSDGEGCERFWSAIRHLIAGLRVSGFFRRVFVLDRQMCAMDVEAKWKIGSWLRRRWNETSRRLYEAQTSIAACGVTEDVLGQQWTLQVEAQLVKQQRQSAKAGDKAINEILVAMGHLDELREEIRDCRIALRDSHKMTAAETQSCSVRIERAEAETARTKSEIARLNAALGTEQCRRLEKMQGDAYLCARVNARALRANIRRSLCSHKFERRKLERAYRHQILQAKDHAQTKDLVHKRQGNISAQVRKFNAVVDHMELLIRQGKKPRGRVHVPRRLDAKKLFRLDVDDDVWQEDPGLGPQDEGDLPRWQIDEDVKRGIAAMLEKRRCTEEAERLRAEVVALADWWTEEFLAVNEFLAVEHALSAVRAAAEWRMGEHKEMRRTWRRDVLHTPLLDLFDQTVRLNIPNDPIGPADHTAGEDDTPDRGVSRRTEDSDSDDASDVYSDIEDEDEPLAEMLDELDVDGEADVMEPEPIEVQSLRSDTEAMVDEEPDVPKNEMLVQSVQVGLGSVQVTSRDANANGDADLPVKSGRSTVDPPKAGIPTNTETSKTEGRAPRINRFYRAGNFTCWDDDVDRMKSRTAWLSGDGLSVFAQGKLVESSVTNVSVTHSRLLQDVQCHADASNDTDKAVLLEPIVSALKQLVHPGSCSKWLVLAHVPLPPHWTLVEVRWEVLELHYYDSFARVGGYAAEVERKVRLLLDHCSAFYEATWMASSFFKWVEEKRAMRQFNGWDCGPFAARDLVSLLTGNEPSGATQDDMARWRQDMADFMEGLLIEEVVQRRRGGVNGQAAAIDVDAVSDGRSTHVDQTL